jgi:hypothetical protein
MQPLKRATREIGAQRYGKKIEIKQIGPDFFESDPTMRILS